MTVGDEIIDVVLDLALLVTVLLAEDDDGFCLEERGGSEAGSGGMWRSLGESPQGGTLLCTITTSSPSSSRPWGACGPQHRYSYIAV